ncbi:MAG: sigma-70 family RNA polymerase sigma factor [Burkholderiales bacterium]|nr:sigma-70 family RNA polymerase sigma factor [Burkholderiales bacterium]MCC7116588.1 sigma-70 family RNA polymerase sigma factor [Burkholderiales bacterium]
MPSPVLVDDDADRGLVERCRQGDRQAYTELVVRYQRPVYNAAWWVLKSADDAADVAQETFAKVAERLDDYDPRHRFFSWIYRIAVNEAIDHQRRRVREEPLDDDVDVPDIDRRGPEQQASDAQTVRLLERALVGLSAQDRAVITMRHYGELSYREIADALDVDEKTVKSRLHDARGRLRARLADLEPGSARR